MFQKLSTDEVKNLKQSELNKALEQRVLEYATDLQVECLTHGDLASCHTFYQLVAQDEIDLPLGLLLKIKAINQEKVVVETSGWEQEQEIILAPGVPSELEFGGAPFSVTYKITASNIVLGKIMDL